MSENLFLGDSTYPHTPSLVERLRLDRTRSMYGSVSNITIELETIASLAADRIEQLERELGEAKRVLLVTKGWLQGDPWRLSKDHVRVAAWEQMIETIDAAINGVKA